MYMPVSLAVGKVQTPDFPVEKRLEWYDIMLRLERSLPFRRMGFMVALFQAFSRSLIAKNTIL